MRGNETEKNMEESLLIPKESLSSSSTTWGVLSGEVKKQGYIAAPMVAVTLSQYLLQVVSMMMVGHLGQLALSSTAMAISLASVTGFSVLVSPIIHTYSYIHYQDRDTRGFVSFVLFILSFDRYSRYCTWDLNK